MSKERIALLNNKLRKIKKIFKETKNLSPEVQDILKVEYKESKAELKSLFDKFGEFNANL